MQKFSIFEIYPYRNFYVKKFAKSIEKFLENPHYYFYFHFLVIQLIGMSCPEKLKNFFT